MLLTAAEGAFAGLATLLVDLKVQLLLRPLLRFAEPESWHAVDTALDGMAEYAALAITSPRGAAALGGRMALRRAHGVASGAAWRLPSHVAIWTSGAATSSALGEVAAEPRWPADGAVRTSGAGLALADAMLAADVRGPVLYACGDRRRDELPTRLRDAGIVVHEVVCYRTVLASLDEAAAAAALADLLVVASPSVARLLADVATMRRPLLIAVGPTTAAAAAAAGWTAAAIADAPTPLAVARAVRTLLPSSPTSP